MLEPSPTGPGVAGMIGTGSAAWHNLYIGPGKNVFFPLASLNVWLI